ncbi:MAG: hypothetical protein HY807_02105 [Nitrospirae bacterium]|nr:hypothetical protein [Nitrospirota bacterium]
MLSKLHKEIRRDGFAPDFFLPIHPDMPVYGLNIAFGWPLPSPLKESYEYLYRELLALGYDIYVYPYHQTHVTVMTLVNFKKHQYPGEKVVEEIEKLVPDIIELLSRELSAGSESDIKTFKIDVGPPILFKSASILPIRNPDKTVYRLREKIALLMKDAFSLEVEVPQGVHSTILRFLKSPSDANVFIQKFESIAANTHMGEVTINELLLTSETKPYMRGGEILHRFRLGE